MATILIVDDHPANREFLSTLLGYQGHRLIEASDGVEALKLVQMARPDLIIADILMPTMDGYEFVYHLRADPAVAETTVIFYTAHYLEREAQALAQACGVAHILFKPSEPEEVLRIVDEALRLSPSIPAEKPDLTGEAGFDHEHLRLVTDKLSQKADELTAVNQRLRALIELGQQLVLEHDPHLILEKFCHVSRTIIGARYAAIGVLEKDKQTLRHFLTSGLDEEAATQLSAPIVSRGLIAQLLTEGRTIRLRDLDGEPEITGLAAGPGAAHHPVIGSFLGAPIATASRLYGWLYLGNKIGAVEFSEEDERIITTVAAQVAVAYENGRRYEQIQRHADELEQEMAERRRVEQELREAEAKYRTLVEQLPAISYIVAYGDTSLTLYISPQIESLLGFTQAEWLADPDLWHQQLHVEDKGRVLAEIQRVNRTGEPLNIEYRMWNRGGQLLWFRNKTVPVQDETGQLRYVHGVMFDITEQKRLEEQFLQAQKMEAVGRLAGGVAHDFNNMLVVITGYSELLLQRDPPDIERLHQYAGEIHKAGERAAGLTRQLLAFSRKQMLQLEVLDLNEVVTTMEKMLRRLIGEDVELISKLASELGQVKADPGQLEQVLMNLAINARDAMPDGGTLIIETANVELDELYTRQYLEVTPGSYVMMAVSDTGIGMDRETLSHVFEPFFTTKAQGKGTGLGLATVYGIIKQSGGHIGVYSELSVGTTLKVYLPRLKDAIEPVKELSPLQTETLSGTETILVVEDETLVRQIVSEILTEGGYTVLKAVNGSEALQLYQQYPGPIHLLLTDMVMPGGFNGRELAKRLQQMYPGLKVLYMSGYTDNAIASQGLDTEIYFLQKPFTALTLERKVREVLNAP